MGEVSLLAGGRPPTIDTLETGMEHGITVSVKSQEEPANSGKERKKLIKSYFIFPSIYFYIISSLMWLHHSMFTRLSFNHISQHSWNESSYGIAGNFLLFFPIFSVMLPKSNPPIVEASVEMGFVASLHSEVVVKFRCEEEEVLEKSLHQLIYWLTIEFFSILSKWKHIYQAKVLTVSALSHILKHKKNEDLKPNSSCRRNSASANWC